MQLNELKGKPGATKLRKRVGWGIGSGTGKTGGRGMKGQKSRSGVAIKGFEGGQMPIHRRLPKRGFTNIFAKNYNEVSVGRIQAAIDSGHLDADKPVDADALIAAGILQKAKDGVKVLNNGEIKTTVKLSVAGASKAAVAAVEKAGGSVEILSGNHLHTIKLVEAWMRVFIPCHDKLTIYTRARAWRLLNGIGC